MLGGGTVLFVVTAAALLAACLPATRRALTPGRLIVWGGLVMPTAVLTALVIAALTLGERLLASPSDPAPLRVEALARQWVWEFRYPALDGLKTTDTLHIPAGRDIDFVVVSADVIHSFWIPRLGGKIDAIPGHVNVIRLRADRPGTYGGVCAEFCGDGHTVMRFTVEAHEAKAFPAALDKAVEEAR
jgi:cytochrome c oxidase subunit 2